MTAVIFFIVWFCGFAVGVSLSVFVVYKIGTRAIKDRKIKKESNEESLSKRMNRVKDITEEQLELAQRTDGPQKNALDGKYKNNILRQIKALDQEKTDILNSILADGHDPELTAVDESGVVMSMKLSEYMAYNGIKANKKDKENSPTKQIGKFTVVKGGKSDGGETTH